jgi:hypothetical protein
MNVWGISILNVLFFATGFSLLCSFYKLTVQNKILWLTMPTIFFAFIPYSEALFFLLSAITLYGIKNNNRWIVWISLFLLSLTRATGVFLAPALLIMSLVSASRNVWRKSLFNYLINYLAPMVAGTACFVGYQYLCSGKWFVYFETQEKFWGHKFNWPVFPFSTFGGPVTIWLSALAVFIDFCAIIFLAIVFFRWLFKRQIQEPLLIVSCGYLLMTLLEGIFFNPIGSSNTTNLPSLFRYTIMTPFFYVFLNHFTNKDQYSRNHYVLVFFLSNIVWLFFGSYVHIQFFIYFMCNTIIIFLYMLLANKKLEWPVVVLIALNFYSQVHLYQIFLAGTIYPD